MVIAFGGDGTVNEAANGLRRLRHAALLPAGRLGQRVRQAARDPRRVVDATEHLLALADRLRAAARSTSAWSRAAASPSAPASAWTPSVVERRRRQPAPEGALRRRTSSLGGASRPSLRRYLRRARRGCWSTSAARRSTGVTAIVQNGAPSPTSTTARSTSPTAPRSTAARSPGVVLRRAGVLGDAVDRLARGSSPRARVSGHRQVTASAARTELTVQQRRRAARCRCRSTATTSARSPRRASRSARAR